MKSYLFIFLILFSSLTQTQEKDSWVIELLFMSLSSKSDPLKAATDWSFCSFIERNTGSIKKKNIVKHPVNTAIEVFIFIIVKIYIGTI